jgi:hypothetical protein
VTIQKPVSAGLVPSGCAERSTSTHQVSMLGAQGMRPSAGIWLCHARVLYSCADWSGVKSDPGAPVRVMRHPEVAQPRSTTAQQG